jgi:hypothetical protein
MSYSARGDREHCIRITTARQKNQHFRVLARSHARIDTRCSGMMRVDDAPDATRAAIVQCRSQIRIDMQEIPMTQGFFGRRRADDRVWRNIARTSCALWKMRHDDRLSMPRAL